VPFREPALSLRDIAEAIDAIKRFAQGMDAAAFREDAKTVVAVECKLQVISEAAIRLGEQADVLCPGLPWRNIRSIGSIDLMQIGFDFRRWLGGRRLPCLTGCGKRLVVMLSAAKHLLFPAESQAKADPSLRSGRHRAGLFPQPVKCALPPTCAASEGNATRHAKFDSIHKQPIAIPSDSR
jgi:hypothetical protein